MIVLGAQILLGAGLLLTGFYFFIDTFERSTHFHPDAGALRIGLSALAIGCGGLIAAFGLAEASTQSDAARYDRPQFRLLIKDYRAARAFIAKMGADNAVNEKGGRL